MNFSVSGVMFAPIFVMAFSGSAASPLDQQSGFATSGSVASIQPGSATPSVDNELIVTVLQSEAAASIAIDSGFTITDSVLFAGGTTYAGAFAYLKQTTAAAVNPTWSWSSSTADSATAMATFK